MERMMLTYIGILYAIWRNEFYTVFVYTDTKASNKLEVTVLLSYQVIRMVER